MNFVLVTAIFGDYEPLLSLPPGVRGICFTDREPPDRRGWDVRRLRKSKLPTPRLQNRYVKTQLHKLVGAELTLYIDGSFKVLTDPEPWARAELAAGDFAAYRHPQRDCVYAEAAACLVKRRGDPEVIRQQVERYRSAGLPTEAGLYGGGILLRRMTAEVKAFGDAWWSELRAGSDRDQISLGFLVWQRQQPVEVLPGGLYKPPFAKYVGHKRKKR